MDMKKDAFSIELDIYINLHLHPDVWKVNDLYESGGKYATGFKLGGVKWALDFLLKKMELTFSEKLLQIIEKKGRRAANVYTKAGVTKNLFSKIKSDKNYHPTKETSLAFAVALHLNLEETNDLIRRAGYSISHSNESDLIVEFFIDRGVYDVDEINYQLYSRGHKPLTNWRRSRNEQINNEKL